MANNGAGVSQISPDLLLPDLLREHPEARGVLDRHGLRGCGGRLGPYESIRFFARSHGVDEARLLSELRAAISEGARATGPDAPGVADAIYRRYFLGAIALVLTAGATWGAWLLWRIGQGGSFHTVSLHQVNAHGEAQVFGWVGLFIMGFAYQAFPRFWGTTLAWPKLATWAFPTMVVGLIARTLGMATAGEWAGAPMLALAGGVLEIAAVLVFVAQIIATFERSGRRAEPSVGFIMAALACFAASSMLSVWHTWNTMLAQGTDELVWYVATYQAPLRDLQVHGMALLMIFGVAIRMLPALYDLPQLPDRRAWWALDLLATALLAEVALFLVYRWTGRMAVAECLWLAWGMLAAGVLLVIVPWRPWRAFPTSDRSSKFLRAAMGWLVVSLTMLLLLPVYQLASGIPFSHAYYGASRHAITVGFISLMIMGMAAKVVPTLAGLAPEGLSRLWGPFVLVNVGCTLRVSTQVLTDWYDGAYALIGLSGMLEVTGLAWWGAGLVRIMLGRDGAMEVEDTAAAGPETVSIGSLPGRIEPQQIVADVLARFPETEPVFARHGFDALRQPLMRRTLARRVTLAQAARLRGVCEDELIADLNAAIGPRPFPLPDRDPDSSNRPTPLAGVTS